ncbi:hypothetical protein, partial [Ralstonia solanacearum]|uniref:hypothetical protein n=2 Tax=Ralstonia TaxID=48736 RepID=UPI001C70CF8F
GFQEGALKNEARVMYKTMGLTPCELARWNLTKMLRCKQARNNLSNKWFGGPDQDHIDHITNNVDPAIERYRNAVDKLCKPGCNK